MKQMMKSYIGLLLVVLITVACGPVTPVATPIATNLPGSPTLSPTTPTPSPISLSPSDGPDKDISSYRLRTWTEDDYRRIVASLEDLVGEDEGQIPYLMLPDYRTVFQLEHLLKFPGSPHRSELLWDILRNKPETVTVPGVSTTDDLMSQLILDLLNQNVQPKNLSGELEKHDLQVINTITINNIVGNGEDGLVLLINMYGFENMMSVFVIFRNDEMLHVQKIRDWELKEGFALYRDFEIYEVGDTNDNGLPEVVVQVQASSGGIGKESIDHIEWSPKDGTFQSTSFPVFWQDCDRGPCEGDWEFSTLDSQSILSTKSYWSTRDDCPDLAIKRVFVWDSAQYALKNSEIIPPTGDTAAECGLAWAETAIWMPTFIWDNGITEPGWKNDLAISIIGKSLTNWPTQADEVWGSASRDYFTLKLGIWYELRNETGKAKSLLNQVAKNPYQTEYDFIPRLASLYLEERAGSGRMRACLELENAYFEEFHTAIPEPSPFNNDEKMLAAWGVVDGKGSFCDIYDMLPADLKDARLTSVETLMQWLEKTELTIYQKEDIDLNTDGLMDHVILLDTTDSESPDVWAFLATPNGYQAAYISEIWLENEPVKVDSINVGEGISIHLMISGGDLIIFRVTSDLKVEILAEEFGVQSFSIDEMPLSISVQIDNNYDGKRTIVFLWDSSSQNFVEPPDHLTTVQAEIEKVLYIEEDFQGIINYIDDFLQAAPPEPQQAYACGVDIPEGCLYLPEWYMPYFRYLHGLAYEQLGQAEQAKQAYYELWRDYPNNVFGMAASLKLERVNP